MKEKKNECMGAPHPRGESKIERRLGKPYACNTRNEPLGGEDPGSIVGVVDTSRIHVAGTYFLDRTNETKTPK